MDHHQNDETDKTPQQQSATASPSSLSPSNNTAAHSNNADRSRRIYERIFAEAIIPESPSNTSTDVSVTQIPPLTGSPEDRYSFLASRAASEAFSCNSAPTDEEEWRGRNQQQQHLHDITAEAEGITSMSEAAAAGDKASVSHQQKQQQQSQHQQDPYGGGRLWRLAGEVAAARKASLLENTRSGPVGHLAETFRERMRSRADPDALVAPPTPPRPNRK